jgi:hypothetical protein
MNPASSATAKSCSKSTAPPVFFQLSSKPIAKSSWESAMTTQDDQSPRMTQMDWDWLEDVSQSCTNKRDAEQDQMQLAAVDALFGNFTFR